MFGSKKVYTAGVEWSQAFESGKFIDPTKGAIIKSVLDGGDMLEYMTQAANNGLTSAARKYLNYGKTKYMYKLPEGDTSLATFSTSLLKSIIETEIGKPINLLIATLDTEQTDYFVFEWVQKNYGWRSTDNVVLNPPAGSIGEVNIDSYDVVEDSFIEIKFRHNVKYSYIYVKSSTSYGFPIMTRQTIATFSYFYLRFPLHNQRDLNYGVVYTEDGSNEEKYWTYRPVTNKYPELAVSDPLVDRSPYYPIVPIRNNKVNLTAQKSTNPDLYNQAKKMLGFFDLDLEALTKEINKSGSIGDIEEVFFLLAADMRSKIPIVNEYLFRFWKKQIMLGYDPDYVIDPYDLGYSVVSNRYGTGSYLSNEEVEYDFTIKALMNYTGNPPIRNLTIKDREFNTEIKYRAAEYKLVKGVIGKIGTVTKKFTKVSDGTFAYTSNNIFSFTQYKKYPRSYFTFRRQYSATHYEQVIVGGLESLTTVYGRRNIAVTAIPGNDSKAFVIPLNYDVLKSFNSKDESAIIYECVSMSIYWIHVTKKSFFSSGFFKFLSIVVTVVIAVYTGYFTKLASMTFEQIIKEVVFTALKSIAIDYAVQKLAAINDVLAMVAAVSFAIASGDLEFKFDPKNLLPMAKDLLEAVTMMAGTKMQSLMYEMEDLQKDWADFLKSSEQRMEELEAAMDLLDNENNIFDPAYVMYRTLQFKPNETASSFYTRALETNPGVLSLDYISAFTSMQLKLPEFNGL